MASNTYKEHLMRALQKGHVHQSRPDKQRGEKNDNDDLQRHHTRSHTTQKNKKLIR